MLAHRSSIRCLGRASPCRCPIAVYWPVVLRRLRPGSSSVRPTSSSLGAAAEVVLFGSRQATPGKMAISARSSMPGRRPAEPSAFPSCGSKPATANMRPSRFMNRMASDASQPFGDVRERSDQRLLRKAGRLPRLRLIGRSVLASALFGLLVASANAEPFAHTDACFVRAEPRQAASASTSCPRRRKAVSAFAARPGSSSMSSSRWSARTERCARSAGVARLRPGERARAAGAAGERQGGEASGHAVPGVASHPAAVGRDHDHGGGVPGPVLCAGQVQLHGQRFDLATRLPRAAGIVLRRDALTRCSRSRPRSAT